MDLSLEKLCGEAARLDEILEIDLDLNEILFVDNTKKQTVFENVWTGFSFLKGMGFQKIRFFHPNQKSIENWSKRISDYQQEFIQDPDFIDVEACIWDETKPDTDEILVQCVVRKTRDKASRGPAYLVPLMEAPLGIDQAHLSAFVNEIQKQTASDILMRMQAILNEFKQESRNLDTQIWSQLLGDVVSVSLENGLLDKALSLVEEHRAALGELWDDSPRVLRILSAYEPKSDEVVRWAKIFESFSLEYIVSFIRQHLSSPAGPQIIRLMTYRAQQENEELISICVNESSDVQKILLQWLSPYWRPKHYKELLRSLKQAMQRRDDIELIQYWIQALLQSYRAQALTDLRSFFTPAKFWQRLQVRKRLNINIGQQRSIVKALSEQPSADTLKFFKDIKPFAKGGVADDIERVIYSYYSGGQKK